MRCGDPSHAFFGNSRCSICLDTHPSGYDCVEARRRNEERLRRLPVNIKPFEPRALLTIVRSDSQ